MITGWYFGRPSIRKLTTDAEKGAVLEDARYQAPAQSQGCVLYDIL